MKKVKLFIFILITFFDSLAIVEVKSIENVEDIFVPIYNNIASNVIIKNETMNKNGSLYIVSSIKNTNNYDFYVRASYQMNSCLLIRFPDNSYWKNPISKATGYYTLKCNEFSYYSFLELNIHNDIIKNRFFPKIGNYEFSWKVYQNDDRTGKEWTSNKLIVNIDEKGEVTLIDDIPSPDWTDEQKMEHLQKYENLENEKHIAKTFTEKIKKLNFNKPKENSDKTILEPQKNKTENSKSNISIIFGVLFTIIFGGFAICKTRKKKKKKQEEK